MLGCKAVVGDGGFTKAGSTNRKLMKQRIEFGAH